MVYISSWAFQNIATVLLRNSLIIYIRTRQYLIKYEITLIEK